ncbi:MAG: hypothetical protein IJD73_02825 [Clostridia bacterium]|nr:hypothetical protein [Clostridia bacterium]
MDNIAGVRRDRVAAFKKVFLFVKLGFSLVLSVLGSIYFVWTMFYNQLNLRRVPNPTVADCLKYCENNKFLVISAVICCFIACSFIGFLIMHAIQTLVVKFMMRNANTGG